MYSKEEGTPAEKLPNQVHGNTKRSRYNRIMQEQKDISRENQEKKIGKKMTVLVEDMSFDGNYFVGRSFQDVPEIDGVVYIKNDGNRKLEEILNNFVDCEIIDVSEYDLMARFVWVECGDFEWIVRK